MPAAETVFMFSGQGSQYFHMGRALYDDNDTFRGWMVRLDEVARQASGSSVIEALYSDARAKGEPFDRTLLTHPAIFMVEYALAQALIHAGVVPDLVLGVSMGSFAAAAVAGFIDVEDALTAVIRQAMSLEECSEAVPVHRLDIGTSGVLIAARTPEAYRALREAFGAGTIDKQYLAIVDGHPAARIADLRKVERVMRAGRVYDPKALYAALGVGARP